MTRLIDADALIEDIRQHSESYFADDFAHEWVDKQPTVDAIPIVWLREHMITDDEVVEYFSTDAMEINLYGSDLIDKWHAERKEE